MPTDYDWITTEMFDEKLAEVYGRVGLSLAEVYDIASEKFNNQVLEELESERDGEVAESRHDRPPEALHRCDAWDDCAYFATVQYTRQLSGSAVSVWWICTNCSKLAKLDGWRPVST